MTTFRASPAVAGHAVRDTHAGIQARPGPPRRRAPGPFGRHAAPRRPVSATSARWFLLAWLAAFALLAANAPGRMIFDTKLGVDMEPARFFAQLWHLWNPREWFGTLQDQYIGYAVPMAPFYLAGQLLHVPVWITERLWLSLLLAIGFFGLVRLAAALGIGSESSRTLAGVVFALWPTITIVIGSTSAAIVPALLAPWAVLPLVSGDRGGSPMVAAARSGAVIACMGGVNAVATIDALVLPALFIITRRRVRMALWWGGCVLAATSWWLIPLLLQGRYSFNFLPYVEQAATTTKTMSAAAFLRGSGNWTAYFNLGIPWLAAGWAMVATPVAMLASAVAAATGLAGVARRDMPETLWLRLSMGIAAVAALAGYWGPLGGLFHGPADRALDGPLAPFRNVYKLEPVVAVVLTLGIAHAAAGWWQRASTIPRLPGVRGASLTTGVAAAVAVAGLAVPYLSGQILQPGSFTRIPRWWYQVADFLDAHARDAPSLVVPADAHGLYLWGDPIDDPLEALARSPWVQRGLVPFGGPGSQSLLATAENAIESGQQVPGLATYLQRAGIRYLVVRNDLDPAAVGYTPPQVVHDTLDLSGFRRVAAFGPLITGNQTDPQAPPQVRYLLPRYPAVEVFQTVAAPPSGPATVLPAGQATMVGGGPDSLLQLAGQGMLGTQPAVIAGDSPGVAPARFLVTDGLRRADTAFGLVNSDTSYTYTATETNPPDSPLGGAGGPPRQLLPAAARDHQTIAVLSGAAEVRSSSRGPWLAETQLYDPVNAFDRNPATAWTEGDPATPVGQWIEIRFDHPLNLPGNIGIRLLDDSPFRAIATGVRISTAAGRASTTLAATGASQQARVAPGRTSWLRLTITAARGVISGGSGAGIRDVLIPGVTVTRYLQPARGPSPPAAFSFHQQVPSPATFGDPAAQPPLARTFWLPAPASLQVKALARAIPGGALDTLLGHLAPTTKTALQVTASSSLGSLPGAGPANLFGNASTRPWIAGSTDPVIHLSWHGNRSIDEMVLQPAYGISAAPQSVLATSPAGNRQANVGLDGLVQFVPPLITDRMDISFPDVAQVKSINPLSGQPAPLPVGLAKLRIPALAGLRVITLDAARQVRLPCGDGPALTVDGHTYPTTVSGTVGALDRFLPVETALCGPGTTLRLAAGRHWLAAAAPAVFTVTDVSLTNTQRRTAGGAPGRVLDIFAWRPEIRQLGIGPGPVSYLEVHENANRGWQATLGGRRLQPVVLDGWQQGFVVPAGEGGIVTLRFAPATLYHAGLVVSVLAIAALLTMALRREGGPSAPSARAAGRFRGGTGSLSRAGWGLGLCGVFGVILVVGGPVAAVVPVLAAVALRRPRMLPAIAGTAMLAAGLFTATAARPAAMGSGPFGAPAQAFALVALTAALMPQPPDWLIRRWRPPERVRRRFERARAALFRPRGAGAGR